MYLIKDTVSGKYLNGLAGPNGPKGKLILAEPTSGGLVRALMFSNIFVAGKALAVYAKQRDTELERIEKQIPMAKKSIASAKKQLTNLKKKLASGSFGLTQSDLIDQIKEVSGKKKVKIGELLELTRALNRMVNGDEDDDYEYEEDLKWDIQSVKTQIKNATAYLANLEKTKQEILAEKNTKRLDIVYASETAISGEGE